MSFTVLVGPVAGIAPGQPYADIPDEAASPQILYTPMPPALIWQEWPRALPAGVLIRLEGRLVAARPASGGGAVVERLFSTDPQDYLDPRFQPGVAVALPGGLPPR